jgi:hypothetical protein
MCFRSALTSDDEAAGPADDMILTAHYHTHYCNGEADEGLP